MHVTLCELENKIQIKEHLDTEPTDRLNCQFVQSLVWRPSEEERDGTIKPNRLRYHAHNSQGFPSTHISSSHSVSYELRLVDYLKRKTQQQTERTKREAHSQIFPPRPASGAKVFVNPPSNSVMWLHILFVCRS